VACIDPVEVRVAAASSATARGSVTVAHPRLWGPPPQQRPNRYVMVTSVSSQGRLTDRYETPFGIRAVGFDPDRGILVNGERVTLQGVNNHHDLGALGAAFNTRAARRQLASDLPRLARTGPARDGASGPQPSLGEEGAAVARELQDIVHEEDGTRPVTTAMNFAKPDMPLPAVVEVISLNYQGEGIRDSTPPVRGRGVRLDRLGLPGRAVALRRGPQLLFRDS
jgi:hypothetical protein